jgi:hypothetical protein
MTQDNIGALWKPSGDNQKAPLAKGKITVNGQEIAIVIWPNRWKAQDLADGKEGADRKPDYFIQIDKPREKVDPDEKISNEIIRQRTHIAEDAFQDDIPF